MRSLSSDVTWDVARAFLRGSEVDEGGVLRQKWCRILRDELVEAFEVNVMWRGAWVDTCPKGLGVRLGAVSCHSHGKWGCSRTVKYSETSFPTP